VATIQDLIRQIGLAPTKSKNLAAMSKARPGPARRPSERRQAPARPGCCPPAHVHLLVDLQPHASTRRGPRPPTCQPNPAGVGAPPRPPPPPPPPRACLPQMLVELHAGEVPASWEALEALPGVGHKTASVVMSQAFG